MFDIVIGLEIHVKLNTDTKLFCSCSNSFSAEENSNICEVCTGQLGALPVLNKRVVEYAIRAAKALNCNINNFFMFDRKHYFYPDLPKSYQITQFYHPYAEHGSLDVFDRKIGITRIHIEEDAGKLIHSDYLDESYVDYNRSSAPLIEIVSDPELTSAEEVHEFLTKLRTRIKYTGASDVSMELGSMRCDVNISVKRKGEEKLGNRVEIKNLNSFKSISKAIEYESSRQIEAINNGETIDCETRLWDDSRMMTRSMREKESSADYRYCPDNDLPAFRITQEYIDEIDLPEFPEAKVERFIEQYNIPEYDANVLSSSKELADYFEESVKYSNNPKSTSNWIMVDILRIAKDDNFFISPKNLGNMIKMIDTGIISGKIAKDIFEEMVTSNKSPEEIVEEKGLKQISDKSVLKDMVSKVLDNNPGSVEDFKAGKEKVIGFLVGQVMKESRGKANPDSVNKILLEDLKAR